MKFLLKEITMFIHKYATFVLIDNSAKPEPREITIDTEKVISMGTHQCEEFSDILNEPAHIATWVMEFISGTTLTVKLECPCTDYDEQGNQIDVDTDMAYDYFKKMTTRSTIEVISMIWE